MITVIYLWRIRKRNVMRAIWHMAIDRRILKADKSVGFYKLLGTGTGETFTPKDADPTLWGLIINIEENDLPKFDIGPMVTSWRKIAKSEIRYLVAPISTHGKWSGVQPFSINNELVNLWRGKVLAVTRAQIRWHKSLRFWRAVPPVISSLRGARGLESAIGIGEAPIGLQGTLSIWSDTQSLEAFVFKGAAHSGVIRQTHSERWYAEELFARFALLEVRGSIAIDK